MTVRLAPTAMPSRLGLDIPDGNAQTMAYCCMLDCTDMGNNLDCPTGMICSQIQIVGNNGPQNTGACVWDAP